MNRTDDSSPDAPWPERATDHVWYPYAQMRDLAPPVPVAGVEGCRIRLADGRELVDGTSSWWSACHGYRHPHIMQAVQGQLETLPHVMLGGMTHEPVVELAQRLAEKTPGDLAHTMFTESGSVSVELALKMARQFWDNRGEIQRDTFIAFENGYHGDTAGCMGVSDTYRDLRPRFPGLAHEHISVPLPPMKTPSPAAKCSLNLRRGPRPLSPNQVSPCFSDSRGFDLRLSPACVPGGAFAGCDSSAFPGPSACSRPSVDRTLALSFSSRPNSEVNNLRRGYSFFGATFTTTCARP